MKGIGVWSALFLSGTAVVASARTWTSAKGTKVEAELAEVRGATVILRAADGRTLTIPILQLSAEDQAFVRESAGGTNAPAASPPPATLTPPAPPVSPAPDKIPATPAQPADPAAEPPAIPPGFVGGPTFTTKTGEMSAGKAFLLAIEGHPDPLLISCHHTFGPDGGLDKQIPQADLPAFVKRVKLEDIAGKRDVSGPVEALPVPEEAKTDITIFRIKTAAKVTPGRLASAAPAKGETIWLISTLGSQEGRILHRAVVLGDHQCEFDIKGLETRGASGGPYVNAKGEVVGLHSGSMTQDGRRTASFVNAEDIRRAIAAALAAAPEPKPTGRRK